MVKNNLMKYIPFSQTSNWNIKQFYNSTKINSSFDLKRIGSAIQRRKDQMVVEDDKLYKRITIKTNCGGVVVRDEVVGNAIRTKNQYYVRSGQLAVSKIDARNGAFGIIPSEADGAIITGNFWVYDVDPSIANIQYLILLFSSRSFIKTWQDCSNGSGNRLYLQEQKFLDADIPLPSVAEQNSLVQQYNERIKQAHQAGENASLLESQIDEYLFSTLDISYPQKTIHSEGILKQASFKNLVGWGAQINCNDIKPQEIFHSNTYKNLPLDRFCQLNPRTDFPSGIDKISFIPMECISDTYGEIAEIHSRSSVESKGYTKFRENDILWAKITPCMQNGKCAIARQLINGFGFGSTEFHVFRPNSNILPEFLYCLLRTKILRQIAISYFTGSAGQQRVGTNFLEALTIPNIPANSDGTGVSQEKIIKHIFALKKQIKELLFQDKQLRIDAKKEFEGAVFGEA